MTTWREAWELFRAESMMAKEKKQMANDVDMFKKLSGYEILIYDFNRGKRMEISTFAVRDNTILIGIKENKDDD